MTIIHFPDVSFWQGNINFETMRYKTDYVILKSSQYVVDSRFERNRSECERVGLPFGIYHFYDDRKSPKEQADMIANLFFDRNKPVEIWCDWEKGTHVSGQFTGIKNVVAFMEETERLLKMPMGMYTGNWYFVENTNALTNYFQLQYLKSRPLWLAAYIDHTPAHPEKVKIPRPWKEMKYWQFGTPAVGYEYGVQSKEIDMNLRMGLPPTPPVLLKKLIKGNTTYIEVKR